MLKIIFILIYFLIIYKKKKKKKKLKICFLMIYELIRLNLSVLFY